MSAGPASAEQLYAWIDSYAITRQKRNLGRDFADAVPLAEMLKAHFPRAVDLHNYTPSNAFAQKLDNWRTLQRKVLARRLHVELAPDLLEAAARAEPAAVEAVLWEVKRAIERLDGAVRARDADVLVVEGLADAISTDAAVTPIKIKSGSKILDQRIVSASVYDEMVEELRAKTDAIRKLQERVLHLEQMVELKDMRIEDLRAKLSEENGVQSAKRFLNNLF